MDRCTELSEEHILLGEQRAATRVYEVLRESFVRRSIRAPAEDLERNVIHPRSDLLEKVPSYLARPSVLASLELLPFSLFSSFLPRFSSIFQEV